MSEIHLDEASHCSRETHATCMIAPRSFPGSSLGKVVNRYAAARSLVDAGWRAVGVGMSLCGHEAADYPVMTRMLGFAPDKALLVELDPEIAEIARQACPAAPILTADVLQLDLSDTIYLNLDFCVGLSKPTVRVIETCAARLRGDAALSLTWCRRNGKFRGGRYDDDARNAGERTRVQLLESGLTEVLDHDWTLGYVGWYVGVNGSSMSTVVYRRTRQRRAALVIGDFGPWNPHLSKLARAAEHALTAP